MTPLGPDRTGPPTHARETPNAERARARKERAPYNKVTDVSTTHRARVDRLRARFGWQDRLDASQLKPILNRRYTASYKSKKVTKKGRGAAAAAWQNSRQKR